MDTIINVGVPHIGEQIFQGIGILELIRYKAVSKTWKVFIENVLALENIKQRSNEKKSA